jgi:Photoprotection regulator fluorescence recovery protein
MFEFKWSPSEKKAARAAFDLALARELKGIRQETEALLQKSRDESSIWRVHDYLSAKRREVDEKYDYRYSVLILVFSRLVSEGWLTVDDLSGTQRKSISYGRSFHVGRMISASGHTVLPSRVGARKAGSIEFFWG